MIRFQLYDLCNPVVKIGYFIYIQCEYCNCKLLLNTGSNQFAIVSPPLDTFSKNKFLGKEKGDQVVRRDFEGKLYAQKCESGLVNEKALYILLPE